MNTVIYIPEDLKERIVANIADRKIAGEAEERGEKPDWGPLDDESTYLLYEIEELISQRP